MFKKIIEKYRSWVKEKEKDEVERREYFEKIEQYCKERDSRR